MLDPADEEKIVIPTLMLASEEESAEEVKKWADALKVEMHVERFDGQVHGWMSARGNLEDEKCKEAYEKGYKIFLECRCWGSPKFSIETLLSSTTLVTCLKINSSQTKFLLTPPLLRVCEALVGVHKYGIGRGENWESFRNDIERLALIEFWHVTSSQPRQCFPCH
jgi:hypothetical protein